MAEGVTRQALIEVQTRVKELVSKDFIDRPRSIKRKLAKEIVMQLVLIGDHSEGRGILDKDPSDLLAKLTPVLDKRRLARWTDEAQGEIGQPLGDFDGLFNLKKALFFEMTVELNIAKRKVYTDDDAQTISGNHQGTLEKMTPTT
ncbi:hypothetical protein GOP47_0028638 [Adiantum capillus-veneris]|nr:hypothetical protein GOP47_0028638 [Adiantum capillus-veneris]